MNPDRLSVLSGPDVAGVSTIVQAIRDHAARAPDAVALLWRDQEISYRAFVADAERIVPQIRGGGFPVAVRMERGPVLMATLFAVMQTGVPYLALPSDWPVRRCGQAMARAGARTCLVEGHGAGSPEASDLPGLTPIDPDGDAAVGSGSGAIRAGAEQDPFAVFYTSGSTGAAKSVLSPHAGVFRLACDPRLGFDRTTRTMQATPVAWDGLTLEMWAPLVRGGSCVLHDGAYLSPDAVRAGIRRGVNTLWLTASLFNTFIDEDPECLRGLRLLMTGAERVSPYHVARCRRLLPEVRLVNGYGPVEATSVFVSAYEIPADADPGQEVSIGTAVAGTTIYLLDGDRRITRAGDAGQIAVAGQGLALGYLGDAEATRQSFPVLPLGSGGAPVRVYLTGDLGRIEDDGTLTYLGRLDRQVKIRGVRVDPIEVERAIEKTSGILRAVVVPLPVDGPTKEHLAAFCVTAPGAPVTGEQIRGAVAEVLPQACVPRYVRLLTELPLNANGKADVQRLAAGLGNEPGLVAAGDGLAGGLADVRELLSGFLGGTVHDDADIFQAGATSLTAIRLAVRLQRSYGVRLSVADMMRARTPAKIAELLSQAQQATEPA